MWFRENLFVLLHVSLLKEKEVEEKTGQSGDDGRGKLLEKMKRDAILNVDLEI